MLTFNIFVIPLISTSPEWQHLCWDTTPIGFETNAHFNYAAHSLYLEYPTHRLHYSRIIFYKIWIMFLKSFLDTTPD